MKRMTAFCISIFILLFSFAGCGQGTAAPSDISYNSGVRYDGSLGSAGKMKGKTVVVSIFADDSTTKWDKSSTEDYQKIRDTLKNLKIALYWLTIRGGKYTDYVEFVCDWKRYPDLRYDAEFSESLVRTDGKMYRVQREYITDSIDSDALLKKYGAENIIYIYLFNTDFSNTITSRTFAHGSVSGVDVEYVNLFTGACDYFAPPSTYAHEIMHAFGAPDLYYKNATIPQSYVNHCERISSRDIMFTVYLGELITNEFSELDAYYVGLADCPVTVKEWNLGLSEHEQYGG